MGGRWSKKERKNWGGDVGGPFILGVPYQIDGVGRGVRFIEEIKKPEKIVSIFGVKERRGGRGAPEAVLKTLVAMRGKGGGRGRGIVRSPDSGNSEIKSRFSRFEEFIRSQEGGLGQRERSKG